MILGSARHGLPPFCSHCPAVSLGTIHCSGDALRMEIWGHSSAVECLHHTQHAVRSIPNITEKETRGDGVAEQGEPLTMQAQQPVSIHSTDMEVEGELIRRAVLDLHTCSGVPTHITHTGTDPKPNSNKNKEDGLGNFPSDHPKVLAVCNELWVP